MSTYNDIDIECTECGEKYRGTVWVAIHAGQDPELKDLLLGGELNLISCPGCTHIAFHDHFLIYQEPAAELVAYVYPESQKAREAELRALMLNGFDEAQKTMPKDKRLPYDPVLLFGLESLIELLQNEAALAVQSQVAQVLCRQNMLDAVLLSPAHARRLKTMRVIPKLGNNNPPAREEIIAGIDKLLTIDPALDQYARLLERIKNDAGWKLEERKKPVTRPVL